MGTDREGRTTATIRQRWPRAVDALVGSGAAPTAVKVPLEITALFWVIKVTSTAMGEALGDWLDGSPNLLIAAVGAAAAAAGFLVALRRQLAATRYETATYWVTVAMVATFGTMIADSLHQFLGMPYAFTTLLYAVVLGLVFWRWWARERTLSIHSIDSRRRERFYWATVLATFALGTATGDWSAGALHLGFFSAGLVFLGLMALPLGAYVAGVSPTVTFWAAYVLTRPLGASFADWSDYPRRLGGLGLGTWPVWVTLAVVMVGLVVALRRSEERRDA